MTEKRHIGVLTGGGDCSGLNAVIRAVVRRAVGHYGWRVTGILDGTHGLLRDPPAVMDLTLDLFSGEVLRQGGTMLGAANKGDPFDYPGPDGVRSDRSQDFIKGYRALGLDGLVGVGGDGTMRILSRLSEEGGISVVGIPKTIDNDVPGTEYAVGFATAVNTAVDALDRLQPTAASHHRVMILEVMGRDAGHIAINAGIAGGADVILIPEIPYDIEKVATKIRDVLEGGRSHALMVCSEAVGTASGKAVWRPDEEGKVRYGGVGHYLGEEIHRLTGAETRVTVLGHVQRGGIPTSRDRIVASAYGVRAVDLLAEGNAGRMVGWRQHGVIDIPLRDGASGASVVDVNGALVKTARGLGICLGN
ncbi:MAG: ATP-dependent 6-phosphofructokinase [Rhodospirillales bacterium]|nr:ATP-dependent 6-phosphofructokinase [Rhodospirillales bacterium]MCW9002972.1 ATP-dependent 6-phosphofructokinase [Rhodospirillales bacterium]